MLRLFDYVFYHATKVNTENDRYPSLLTNIWGIIAAAFPLWFNIITLSVWLSIVPDDIKHETLWNYYYIIAGIIVVLFSFRYGSKRYELFKKKWEDRPKTLKNQVFVILYVLGSFFIALITLYFRMKIIP